MQIYQVIYSSVVIFTAILSKFFLHKSLYLQQWLSMLLVTSGLVVSAMPKLAHLRKHVFVFLFVFFAHVF